MRKWNGYLAIITCMCCCQIVYDISFALHISANDGSAAIGVLNGFQFFGGMSVSIWTNILAVIILRVVMWMKSTDILQNFYYLNLIALVPATVLGIAVLVLQESGTKYQAHIVEEMYYWSRLVSILINFVAHAIIELRAFRTSARRTKFTRTPQEMAIKVLAQRMIYYPLMQTISRLGASIYEARYGFGPYTGNSSTTRFAMACCYAGLSPATGIGYLCIFLMMQPYAMEQLRSIVSTGGSIDQTSLEIRKRNFRRSSFINQRGTTTGGGSECTPSGSSLTKASDLENNTSSVSHPSSAIDEVDEEFYYMDDQELVNTIQRVENKSQQPPTLRTTDTTINTMGTEMTTSNPIYSMGSDVYSVNLANALKGKSTVENQQL